MKYYFKVGFKEAFDDAEEIANFIESLKEELNTWGAVELKREIEKMKNYDTLQLLESDIHILAIADDDEEEEEEEEEPSEEDMEDWGSYLRDKELTDRVVEWNKKHPNAIID